MPGIIRAQSSSKPVKIGLLSDMGGPYRDVGGPGNKVATELAIQDFGGSVLGPPVEVMQADDHDKPDVSTSLARQWIDDEGVDVLADGAASSSGLAIQRVCREKKKIYLITGAATSDMTGNHCSPYGIHFSYDTYALAHGTGNALTKSGGDSSFFITADYAFGYALERDTASAVKAAGGKVLGSVRAPLGTADFSSYLVQAQASGAKVIGFANASTDTQNCVKQAAEFRLTRGRQIGDAADADQRRERTGAESVRGSRLHRQLLLGHDQQDTELSPSAESQVRNALVNLRFRLWRLPEPSR